MTVLCLASYEKGHDFLREARRLGCRVVLITSESLKETASWPLDSIDEIFYMQDDNKTWNPEHLLYAVSYMARSRVFDRIVPLDDFDLELAALLREHLRLPGLGETATRFFRDKLAMRMRAREAGIAVPDFIHVLNHDKLREFMERVASPWVLKPRMMAGAMGIRKLHGAGELWPLLEMLGDQQSFHVLERYVPGDVFHVDSIVWRAEVRFAVASRYGFPPLDVSHGGGVFTSRLVERGSNQEHELLALNARVLCAMGLENGVSHSEFIRAREDGRLYFLETSARVGGAHLADLVEAGTGVNLWAEWARIETAAESAYQPPHPRFDYAGLVVCLARQERPDLSAYSDPEIVWRLDKENHAGLIVRSRDPRRVEELLANIVERFRRDFMASAPPRDKPSF